MDNEEQIIYYGGAVKALGEGKVGGYLVRFTSDKEPDLVGEFFTKDTDFGEADSATTYYNHGQDPVLKMRKLGKAVLTSDDFGVWAETQLNMRDEYEKFIYEMAEEGKQGWSSGTAGHLVEREEKGEAVWLKSWPLGLDASITPTPAEPANGVIPLKSIEVQPLMESEPKDAPGEEPAQEGGADPEAPIKGQRKSNNTEVINMEITEEKLTELLDNAAKKAVEAQPEPVDVEAAVSAGVEKAMKDLPATKEAVKVEIVTDEADQPWETGGDFFIAVKNATLYPQQFDKRLLPLKASGLNEAVPADGGYLLAPQIAGGLFERMYNTGQLLQRVASDPIGPNSNSALYNAVDETSRAEGSRWGGLRGYWTAEAACVTSSKPQFRQMELKLKKVAALCYATDEQLMDTVNLESWLTRTVPNELRFQVEDAFYNGNGVGKPLGIMQAPALVSVTRIDANEVDETDIANMWARRWAGVDDYVWISNQSVFPQLINLTLGNAPFLLPNNQPGQASPRFSLYGAPYLEVEYTAALGTTGDIMLASLSQYQTINKGGIQSASSIHVQFDAFETAFRFMYRTDGQPLWDSALTPKDAGNTVSPFVVLTAAST